MIMPTKNHYGSVLPQMLEFKWDWNLFNYILTQDLFHVIYDIIFSSYFNFCLEYLFCNQIDNMESDIALQA